MSEKFETKEYKLSRKAYVAQCTFEYFISILVTDAYLAKMLSHQGISDAMIGIISSFVSLAFLFQLSAIFLVDRVKNTKKTVIKKRAAICHSVFSFCTYYIAFFSSYTHLSRS